MKKKLRLLPRCLISCDNNSITLNPLLLLPLQHLKLATLRKHNHQQPIPAYHAPRPMHSPTSLTTLVAERPSPGSTFRVRSFFNYLASCIKSVVLLPQIHRYGPRPYPFFLPSRQALIEVVIGLRVSQMTWIDDLLLYL